MARTRKRHVQQDLPFKTCGGKRRGAGRPPKGRRPSERHKKRPYHNARHPVHVTIRVVDGIALRKRDMFAAIRKATIAVLWREGFRIVHFSVQGNHIHLIVEAADELTLSRGMQAFQISAARHINAALSARLGPSTGSGFRGPLSRAPTHLTARCTPRNRVRAQQLAAPP